MASFIITEDEQEALEGLPMPAQVLYYALRKLMDFSTGRVGAIYAISWQGLRAALYVEPHRGIKYEYPHKETVRRLAGWLERRGLVRFQSNLASARLIFLLPKALTNSLVQKKADTKPTGSADTKADRGNDELPAKHSHREEKRQRGNGLAQADREADMGKTAKADTYLLSVPSTTTTLGSSTVGVVVETLQWPASATPEEKATWKTMIDRAKLNGDAQLIVDEFSGALLKSAIQNRTGYLRALIARMKQGSFVAERAYAVQDARERASKAKARTSQSRAGQGTPPATKAAARAHLDNIKKRMGKHAG